VTSVVSALLLKEQHLLPIQLDNLSRQILGFYAFASGLGLRFASVVWLGRFFTVQVAVHDGHYLVATGPFRWIRHPSYAGMLLAFLGVGMAMGDWLALAVLLLPVFTAIRKRIGLEEGVLTEFFGAEYVNYAARTKRLIPGVF
jgi:protein-S-isoprenylcysteine O-methyltransferase Ste14